MFGKYRHTVDAKGRLFLPSKLREEIGDVFYVMIAPDPCLTIYTEEAWQKVMDRFNALPITKSRNLRVLLSNAAKCELDKQGRFLIPTEMRQYAHLEQDVTFSGQGERAEIWDTAAFDELEKQKLKPEEVLAAMEELGF